MAYNATASSEKSTQNNYVDFGNSQDKFGHLSWSKNESNYMAGKLNLLKRDYNKDFCLVQKLSKGEARFNQIMQLTNQLIIAAEKFGTEENFSSLLIATKSKDMDKRSQLDHKVVDIEDKANRICSVTLLRYKMDRPHSSYAHVRLFARKMENEKIQQFQNVYLNHKLEEFICLLDVLKSVYDEVNTNEPIETSYKNFSKNLLPIIFLYPGVKSSWKTGNNRNLILKLKTNMRLYHVALTAPNSSTEKLTLTLVGM